MRIAPGNIWSGDRDRAVFTNPTELARWKGNLVGRYPIRYGKETYADVETAYKTLSRGIKADTRACYELCTDLIVKKLMQHPRIFRTLRENGGEQWIFACSHWIGARKVPSRWCGDGKASGFIRCLAAAYERCWEHYAMD